MIKYKSDKLKNPNFFLIFAIVSSAVVMTLVGTHTYNVIEDVLENSRHSKQISSCVEDIRIFDQVLTSSTLLSASTGNAQWEKQYHLFEPKLDSVFNELLQLDPLFANNQMLKMIDSANVHLNELDKQVFELVHLERLNEANEIVTGSEYARQKAFYSEGLSEFIRQYELETDQQQSQLNKAAKNSRLFFGLAVFLLTIIWMPVERIMRKSRVIILNQNHELELQIQAREESERALHESKHQIEKAQEQLQESITASNVGLWERNLQTNELFQSPEFKRQIGYTDDDVQSPIEFYYSHIHPEDAEIVIDSLQQLKNGVIDKLKLEYRFCHKDGSYLWMLSNTSLKRDQFGKPWRLFGSHIDITESKNSEQTIKELNERFNLIAKATNDCVYDWNIVTDQVWWNPALSRLFNYPPDIITTDVQWWEERIHPDDHDSMMQDAQNVFDEKMENFSCEYRFQRADGSYAFVFDRAIILYDENKNPIRWVGSVMDITERKNNELKIEELKTNRELILNAVGEGIYGLDNNSNITFVNKVFETITGWKSEEIIGKPMHALIHHTKPDGSSYPQEDCPTCLTISEGRIFENDNEYFIRKDGLGFFAEYVSTPILKNDKLDGAVVIFKDITERKKSEEKIKESEENYRILAESSPEMIYLFDTKGYITYVNKVAAEQFHAPAKKLIGKHLTDIFPPDLAQQNLNNMQIVIATKTSFHNEVEMVFPKGSRWVDARLNPVFDDQNRVVGVLGLSYDITDRKRADETVAALSKRYQILLHTASDGIHVLDDLGNVIEVNEAFCTMLGYTREELLQLNVADWDIQWSNNQLAEKLQEFFHQSFMFETRHRRKDGSSFDVEINIVNILLEGRNYLYASARDITDRKRAEEEIKSTNEELQKLNAEKDKFFSIIAHDLRSPFSGFLGLTEMLQENTQIFSQTEISDFSRVLNESAKKISLLLENLLQWAQMHRGAISYTPNELSLFELVSENVDQINQRAIQKGIIIQSEVLKNQKVFADEMMINTILRNLLSNAVKFTRRGGKVTIGSKVLSDHWIEISVIDTGVGMSDANRTKLFKIDEKVSSSGTDGEPSTGLGLLLCKEFVEKHGGIIWVTSLVGKGTEFYFSVPVKNK